MPKSLSRQHLNVLIRSIVAVAMMLAIGTALGSAQSDQPATAIGEAAAVGPWQMTLVEVLIGGDAGAVAVNAGNGEAGPGDGLQFIAAHISVQNVSTQAFQIVPGDFGVVGTSGVVRRTAAVFAPSPELNGLVAAGGSLDGWILSSAEVDAQNLVLVYDSTTITGTWADHTFAISEGAEFVPSQDRVAELDKDGRNSSNPVGIGRVVSTPEWTIKIIDVVVGRPVYDLSPVDTQRLGFALDAGGDTGCQETWIAFQIEASNNGGDGLTRYLPQTAFQLADSDGEPAFDVRSLTAPEPEISGEYAAGATRVGWISFERPNLCAGEASNITYDANLIRFQPFATSDDPRFLTWDSDETPVEVPTEAEIDLESVWTVGTTLVVEEDATINLRTDPTTDADVVDELEEGTEVEVTGEPVSAGGYVWYPVQVIETAKVGWVVQDYLEEP